LSLVSEPSSHLHQLINHLLHSFPVLGGQTKDQIKQTNDTSSSSHTYTLVLVPRRTTLCDRILEEQGVLGDLTITSYNLEFIPLEDDLLSLEMDNVWRELYLVSGLSPFTLLFQNIFNFPRTMTTLRYSILLKLFSPSNKHTGSFLVY